MNIYYQQLYEILISNLNHFSFNTHIKFFFVIGPGFISDEGGKVGDADLPFLDLRKTDVVDVLLQGRCKPPLLAPPSLVIV